MGLECKQNQSHTTGWEVIDTTRCFGSTILLSARNRIEKIQKMFFTSQCERISFHFFSISSSIQVVVVVSTITKLVTCGSIKKGCLVSGHIGCLKGGWSGLDRGIIVVGNRRGPRPTRLTTIGSFQASLASTLLSMPVVSSQLPLLQSSTSNICIHYFIKGFSLKRELFSS